MIDATIIVQMCNFLCIWAVFYLLVFRPALAILLQRYQQRQKLEKMRASMSERMHALHDDHYGIWHTLHMQYVHLEIHGRSPNPFYTIKEEQLVQPLNDQHIQSLIDQVREVIVQHCKEGI